MTEEKLKNFEFTFRLIHIKMDSREYRQDSDLFMPDPAFQVCVLLPRENEYVYNLSDISKAELSGETAPDPILTPKGFAYVKKALEAGFVEPKIVPETEEWGNTVDKEKQLNPGKVASEWDETQDWTEEKSDKNKPNVETWEDEKETWE